MNVLVYNNCPCHYEIIESCIIKFCNIKTDTIELYFKNNPSFKIYMKNKFPNIIFKNNINYDKYDKIINCTIYDNDYNTIKKLDKYKYIFVAHEITDKLKSLSNVYFLTPLCNSNNYIYADILPFNDIKKTICSEYPTFIVQGNITNGRRNYDILNKILSHNFSYRFEIKLIGRGSLPSQLKKFKDTIILKNNLSFIDYHKEFINAYGILPLISKKTHPCYYINKLTSTINYAKAYNLKCIINEELQSIYNLNNVVVYKDENDILEKFEYCLSTYYKNYNGKLSSNMSKFI